MNKIVWRISFVISIFIVLLCVISLFYTPYPPDEINSSQKFLSPSFSHLMGTDKFGRDIFSRVLIGSRITFSVAGISVVIAAFVGLFIGLITGYFNGIIDEILMRINDFITAFPTILLALIIVAVLGVGEYNVILALSIVFIPSFARLVRSEVVSYKNRNFVKSAKSLGASNFRIIFVHIMPNIVPIFITAMIVGFNNAILAEASMSYLGLGVQPPTASLGRMIKDSATGPFFNMFFPGMTIVLSILAFSLVSEGLKKQ